MLSVLLTRTLRQRWKRIAFTAISVTAGTALVASLLIATSGISERMSRELRRYGANATILPTQTSGSRYISEDDLLKLKTIFWRHNIVSFAPFLELTVASGSQQVPLTGTWFRRAVKLPEGQTDSVGVYTLSPWWKVRGKKPLGRAAAGEALVGVKAAERLGLDVGDSLPVTYGGKTRTLRVAGILTAGGEDDSRVFVDIGVTQALANLAGKADSARVSAMIVPDSKLPEAIRGKDPSEMTPAEYETWYCTPTLQAIATQAKEVVSNADVKVVRQVAEAEGRVLSQIDVLIGMIVAFALLGAGTSVAASTSAAVIERRSEIALTKAIGATDQQVMTQFLVEAVGIGTAAGAVGVAIGVVLAKWLGSAVFGVAPEPTALSILVSFSAAITVTVLGSLLPVFQAAKVDPAVALRG